VLVKVSKAALNRIAKYDNGGVRDREPTSLYAMDFYDPLSTDKPVFEAGATIATIPPIIYCEAMDPLFPKDQGLEFDSRKKNKEISLPVN